MLRAEWTSYIECLRLSVRKMSYAARNTMQIAPTFKALKKKVLQSPSTRLMTQLNIYLYLLDLSLFEALTKKNLQAWWGRDFRIPGKVILAVPLCLRHMEDLVLRMVRIITSLLYFPKTYKIGVGHMFRDQFIPGARDGCNCKKTKR
jgi:hypothetical protein